MGCYRRQAVAFVRGEGAWLIDEQGRRYLDALSGIAVCSLGHAHPRVTRALREQAGLLLHTSNAFRIPPQELLAARLCELSSMERVFFCNSGTESVECALKIARRHAWSQGLRRPRIVVMRGAFHGRTLGSVSASGESAAGHELGPLLPGFTRVPYGDLEACKALPVAGVAAVLLEPIQGEGGVVPAPPGFLRGLRRLCDERGWLLMLDEVQTGLCRTGRWFACEHEAVRPDVLCLAKALGNGIPIGACLARGVAARALTPGRHGSTFGGNPLASRVALEVLAVMQEEDYSGRAERMGKRLVAALRGGPGTLPGVEAVRGRGLMLGVQLARAGTSLVAHALRHGLLLNVTAGRVVRLLPPLMINATEADEIVRRLHAALQDHLSREAA